MQIVQPIQRNLFLKISMLKSLLYCGALWGLYREGWAMTQEQDKFIFPFWLNRAQAQRYAKMHWPDYTPRKITSDDFHTVLLPTLQRLNIHVALCTTTEHWRLKLSTKQMQTWFFNEKSRKTV